ncbi:MAG: hypothetical protein KJO29_05165 [Bacteroidia bacterium]|nr:hypothetical protein [Bacteroidia bacterium]
MSRLICLAIFIVTALSGSSQESQRGWEEMMGDPNVSFYDIQKSFNQEWQLEEIPGGAGHKPFKRWEYLMETRVNKEGYYNPMTILNAHNNYHEDRTPLKNSSSPWTLVGPDSVPAGNNGIGRINVIAVHPSDTSKIYAGTPAGGLWKSTDGGTSWTTNTDFLSNLGVSDIVFHPTHPDTMYMATGDRDHNDTSTFGILKSTDGGNTWTTTNFQPSINNPFYLIHRILIDPSDGDIMIASTTSGVYRTTDGWSTFTQVLANDCLRHMEFKPGDSNIIYGTTSGNYCGGLNSVATYFRSTDNGVTWSQITLPNTSDPQRIGIGVTAANPSVLYLFAAYNDSNHTNDFLALYKSTDSGATVSEVSVNTTPVMGSQQWYDWSFTVSPTDENLLFGGGVGLRKSTDGGVNWSNSGTGVHVDHHFAQYFGNKLYVGSDGGIWYSSDDGGNWTDLNDGLAITQYYRISNAETDNSIMLAGSQDNGTHQKNGSNWTFELGGDGTDNAIDPLDKDNLFISYQYGNFYRSTNGGSSFSPMIDNSTTGINGAWITPIKIDPNNTNIIYTGYDRIWKSTDDGVSWTDPSGSALTSGPSIQYIDIAKSNSNYLYVTDYSKVWKSTDAGASWIEVTDPGSSIRWIEIDPTDETHLWVCSNNNVYESSDEGTTWINITGSLPDVDMNTIVYDEGSNENLFIGTDLGVYYKDASMTDWASYGTSLPNVVILELDIIESDNKLRAATFGRGIWEVDLSPLPCSIDNIVDLGIISCNNASGLYSRQLSIHYTSPPSSGTLDVMGQSFTIGSSPQLVTLTDLPVDGSTNNVTAEFSTDNSCSLTENNLFTNPANCPCLIIDANIQMLTCDDKGTNTPTDDTFTFSMNPSSENNSGTYSVSGDITASNIPFGTLTTFDNGGTGYLISNGDLLINLADDLDATCSLDNVIVTAPAPCSTNYTCEDAFEITATGIYTAIGPDQGGGGSLPGRNANWFYFVAPSDGIITIQSCGGGVDTRLVVHDGNCSSLMYLGGNDDYCEMSSGSQLYASYYEQCVSSGVSYYIEWDDLWSTAGFNFDFDFSSGIPTSPVINSFPYSESFESTPNSWVLSCDDDMNWTNNTGSTPSNNTGPSTAQNGARYIYLESTDNFNNTGYHIGPTFDLTSNNSPEFSFYYHMYGADMGTLNLEVSQDGGSTWNNIFTKSEDQGDQWVYKVIDLSAYSGNLIDIRFKGDVGPSFTSDMAVDNIMLVDNNPQSCPPVTDVNGNPITDGVYSGIIINSAGVIPSNGQVEFMGQDEINLNSGFEILAGGTLEITANGCPEANAQNSEDSEN